MLSGMYPRRQHLARNAKPVDHGPVAFHWWHRKLLMTVDQWQIVILHRRWQHIPVPRGMRSVSQPHIQSRYGPPGVSTIAGERSGNDCQAWVGRDCRAAPATVTSASARDAPDDVGAPRPWWYATRDPVQCGLHDAIDWIPAGGWKDSFWSGRWRHCASMAYNAGEQGLSVGAVIDSLPQ